jgi:hypothetical protein
MSKSTKGAGQHKTEEEIQKSLDEMEYSDKDDIYSKDEEEDLDLDGEEGLKKGKKTRKDTLSEDDDLDIPGADLDDEDEVIGEEDEENNYYSLGGDDHDDLEETNTDNV